MYLHWAGSANMGVEMRDSLLLYINHRNDSIARASREAAEFIILRHDILYSPLLAVVFGGICVVVSVYLIAKSMEVRNG